MRTTRVWQKADILLVQLDRIKSLKTEPRYIPHLQIVFKVAGKGGDFETRTETNQQNTRHTHFQASQCEG